MKELRNRVAVVTGGGSGIGRGIALAFADAGTHTVIADIDAPAAEKVAAEVRERGVRALPVHTDVMELVSVRELAKRTYAEFGEAHILCNNAGVGVGGPLDEMTPEDWEWVIAVNLRGVANGLMAFLPRFKAQAGETHVVNTASMAGLLPVENLGVYVATKYAVVGLSETLRIEGAGYGLGVSVLCPGLVKTRILEGHRNRPEALGGSRRRVLSEVGEARLQAEGMDPLDVGRAVVRAVERNELYVLTHPGAKTTTQTRFDEILASFDRASRQS